MENKQLIVRVTNPLRTSAWEAIERPAAQRHCWVVFRIRRSQFQTMYKTDNEI